MMSLCVKLALMTLYLLLLIILVKLLELIGLKDGGALALRLIQPFSLNVRQLKRILTERGITHQNALEKTELETLVEGAGGLNEAELELVDQTEIAEDEKSEILSTNFTSSSLLTELVDDNKDSIWLIHVVPQSSVPLLSWKDWYSIGRQLHRFSIKSGTFQCSLDPEFCKRSHWEHARILAAMPRAEKAKSQVTLETYSGAAVIHQIIDWTLKLINRRVKRLQKTHLKKGWLCGDAETTCSDEQPISFVHVTDIDRSPAFYAALSAKFSGRARFGMYQTEAIERRDLCLRKESCFILSSEHGDYHYGNRPDELHTHRHMKLFLHTVQPETNDIFIASFLLTNCIVLWQLFVSPGGLLQRVFSTLWCGFKANLVMLLFWVVTMTVTQVYFLSSIVTFSTRPEFKKR